MLLRVSKGGSREVACATAQDSCRVQWMKSPQVDVQEMVGCSGGVERDAGCRCGVQGLTTVGIGLCFVHVSAAVVAAPYDASGEINGQVGQECVCARADAGQNKGGDAMAVGGGRKRASRWIAFASQPFCELRRGWAGLNSAVGGELVAGSGCGHGNDWRCARGGNWQIAVACAQATHMPAV